MRAILAGLAAVAVAVLVGGPAAGQEQKIDGKLLVGKWAPTDEDVESRGEFTADGKLVVTHFNRASRTEMKTEGSYKLEGSALRITLKIDGQELSHTVTVRSLGKTRLVILNTDGEPQTLRRVTE